MADEKVTIEGRQVDLPTGASVWGGIHPSRDSLVWKFDSKEGATTTLCLSFQAMLAVIDIYQQLAGCDMSFASVQIDAAPAPPSARGESDAG